MKKFSRLLLMIALLATLPISTAQAKSLRSALQSLAVQEGFTVEGIDELGDERAVKTEGELAEQIESLLRNYNYMTIQGAGSKLQQVKITSAKQLGPRPSDRAYVQTTRVGNHHQVEAELTGPNGDRLPAALLVDTGASMIVLPESMIEPLGFKANELSGGMSQTASDTIPVKIGMLRSVRVGNVTAEQVHVSFVPDQRLNGTKLLGMSFLNHFRFSLDDSANELELHGK